MEFTLTYRGQLPGEGNAKEKQLIREYLHPQLRELWEHPPLQAKHQLLTATKKPENEQIALLKSDGGFNFVPLISNGFGLAARVQITFLRNGPPGSIIKQGGDLDNRLKTLFDVLSMPNKDQVRNAPPSVSPPENFYCLLEDDILINSVAVSADRLLNASTVHTNLAPLDTKHPELEVLLLIHVVTQTTRLLIWNMDL